MLGPNGAGKSTLLKTILGFIPPLEGSVKVFDKAIPEYAMDARSLIGYMPETESFIAGLNAVQFVTFMGQLSGLPRSAAIERSHEVLQYVGLGESRYRNLETYSLGMKQRAKLAQAIVHDPKLLLLDEPTNGMDPPGREEMLDLIRDLSVNKGISVILCSHLLKDVETIANEIIVLGNGSVVNRSIRDNATQGETVYSLRIRGDKNLFISLCRNNNIKVSMPDDSAEIYVSLAPKDTSEVIKSLYQIAGQSGCLIQRLEPQKQSLEEIFTRAVGDLQNAHI